MRSAHGFEGGAVFVWSLMARPAGASWRLTSFPPADSIEAHRAISSAAEPLSAEGTHAFRPPRAGMTTLSLAMIVKNEGQTIERVLDCAKAFADEMVVVDTGSTDDTIAKAKAMGAQVHYFSWIDDFAAARNYSFSKCAGDWIIWLDGDDVISPDNQKRILDLKQTVLNDELEAVYLRYLYPPFRQWRERIARRDLFVEGKLKWKEPVHEFIDGVDGRKVRYFDDIVIQHDTPPDRHHQKKDRNIAILRKHVAQRGDRRSQPLYLRGRMSAQYPERRRRAGSRQVLFAGQDSRVSLRDLQQDV